MISKVNKIGLNDASTLTQNNNGLMINNCGNCQLCEEKFDVNPNYTCTMTGKTLQVRNKSYKPINLTCTTHNM